MRVLTSSIVELTDSSHVKVDRIPPPPPHSISDIVPVSVVAGGEGPAVLLSSDESVEVADQREARFDRGRDGARL